MTDNWGIATQSTITAYNIETRYPDLKLAFRKKCAHEFTIKEMNTIKEIFQWIKSQLP